MVEGQVAPPADERAEEVDAARVVEEQLGLSVADEHDNGPVEPAVRNFDAVDNGGVQKG